MTRKSTCSVLRVSRSMFHVSPDAFMNITLLSVIQSFYVFLLIQQLQGFVTNHRLDMFSCSTIHHKPCYSTSNNVQDIQNDMQHTYFILSNGGVEVHFEIVDGALAVRFWGGNTHLSSSDHKMYRTDRGLDDDGLIMRDDPTTLYSHDSRIKSMIQTTLGNSFGSDPNYFSKAIPHSDFDHRLHPGIMREHSRGWMGHPSLLGHRPQGLDWSTHFMVQNAMMTSEDTQEIFHVTLQDHGTSLVLYLSYILDSFGVLRISYRLQNNHKDQEYYLQQLVYWLPLPDTVCETLDFYGRWSKERNPQWRKQINVGRWVRESWEGRPGHSFTIGTLAMTQGTCFGQGQVWSMACAYSGNSRNMIEKTYEGVLSMGVEEILMPGEVILQPGESYEAPQVLAVYSSQGLDGSAQAFHNHVRARKKHICRPMTFNLWEAIYFQHNPERVRKLVDIAAELGVERIVLDDGWFSSRRNDTTGLGDWTISEQVWPQDTLDTIVKYIRDKGIQFGLWFEGEMVNPNSNLFRQHPDWIMDEKGRIVENTCKSVSWRHQFVLNLAHPGAFDYLLESVSNIISRLGVSFIKWDHNRALVNAGYLGRPAIRKQTIALYKFLSALHQRHPLLEIESCASGGARIDFGILDHVDRFWASDCNDALERQLIQRWTMQFFPPEFLGCHIGPSPGHQTHRTHSLTFRTTIALFGHAGIECDLAQYSREDLERIKCWIAYYKKNRHLLHSGTMVRMDYVDEAVHLYGVVDKRRENAIFAFVVLAPLSYSHPPSLRFRGLMGDKLYKVQVVSPVGEAKMMQIAPPEWVIKGTIQATGSWLEQIGLPAPILCPSEALLIELTMIC